jgi:hypothetical protein
MAFDLIIEREAAWILLKRLIHITTQIVGLTITGIALAYVIAAILAQWRQIAQHHNLTEALLIISLPGALVYSVLFMGMGLVWHHMVQQLEPSVTLPVGYWIFSRSQLAKYLPGSMLHVAGRQLLGKMCGISQSVLLAVSTCEIFLQTIASAAIAGLGATMLTIKSEYRLAIAAGACLVSFFLLSALYARRWFERGALRSERLGQLKKFQQIGQTQFLVPPFVVYILHFAAVGALISFIVCQIEAAPFAPLAMPQYTAIYALAWGLGFITPGAPGGIGVREALLTTHLSTIIGTSDALMIAIGLRLAAILADLTLFLTSFGIPRPASRETG